MSMFWRFWRDQRGGLLSTEYIILGALLTLGLIAGITAARNSLSTELEDYADAIQGINTGGLGAPDTTTEVNFSGNEAQP